MSAHAEHGAAVGKDAERLPPEVAKRFMFIGAGVAAVGFAMSLAAVFGGEENKHRFAFSYLTGFYFTLTIALGAMVWTIIQHLARAGWSVAARRQLEWMAGFLPVGAILFLPVAALAPIIYHQWWHGTEEVKELDKFKHQFLNPTTYYAFAALFFAIWTGVSWFYRSRSLEQDKTGDIGITSTVQKYSPPLMFLIGYSLAFSGVFWIMSIDPHWFSTMWGVYIFAGSATSSLSLLALMTCYLQANGYFQRVSTVEHLHDIGKFLFAFVVFFAYIGFCQYFLIWYGNIPEETVFYKERWLPEGGWQTTSSLIPLFHFAVPFLWLLPRTMKRNRTTLAIGACLLLVMHYVDMYWMVMPHYSEKGADPSWIDLAGLLGPAGSLVAWLGYRASRDPIYPLKDPRVPETMRNDNGQG